MSLWMAGALLEMKDGVRGVVMVEEEASGEAMEEGVEALEGEADGKLREDSKL